MTILATGFYPFWFWNDRLTAEEIRWQVAEMARQGVAGFFIHSRQGLGQPYLSEAFFAMVDVAVAAAEEHGLIVHLYDEYPYPSGVAGGRVTLGQPEYHATELIQRVYDVPGGPIRLELPAGKILSLMAYPLIDPNVPGTSDKCLARDGGSCPDWSHGIDLADHVGPLLVVDSYRETGLTRYNQKRYFASRPAPILEATLPVGPHRIFASVQVEVTHHKYWGHFADVLNPQAVAEFVRQTHERYRQRYGDKFGATIRSIFVDETQPGWSARLPDAFREEFGYDLLPLLPALQDATHPDHERVTYDLHRLRYKLFCASWEEPISAWCRAAGIGYSGEKPSLRMAQLRFMDIPGCEPGHTKAGAPLDLLGPHLRQNAKATASAAYFYGKAGSLDECYHSLGWNGTLQDAKLMADGQLLAGITYLVPHGFFYSTHALRKHDAPPTFFFQAPYWPLFGKLAAHVDRIGRLFAGTHIDAEVLLIEPSSGVPTRLDLEAYVRLQALLMENHLDFHFADTDILEKGEIASGQKPPLAMTGACLRVADLVIKLVIVPPLRVIEPPLAEWLARFEAASGRVIRCSQDFAANELLAAIWAVVGPSLSIRAVAPRTDDGDVPQSSGLWLCDPTQSRGLRYDPTSSTVEGEAAPIQVVKRVGGGRILWFALNTGPAALTVELDAGRALREIPLEDGRSPRLTRKGERYGREVAPFESFMLEACENGYDNESAGLNESTAADSINSGDSLSYSPARLTIPLRGPARVRPLNPNLLRLAEWRLSILEEGAAAQTATVPAIPLSDQLERGGFRFAPAVRRYFGHEPELAWPPLNVCYECAFENAYAGPVEFVMEPGSIAGDWRLWINDAGPLTAADLAPTAAHVRGSLGADITRWLRSGANTLRVEISEARPEGGLLNPLYLAGDFGAALHPLGLVERPAVGGFETYEANGLPFYAGVIEYTFDIELARSETGQSGKSQSGAVDGRVRADFVTDAPFHEACEISLNGRPWRALAWEPRSLDLPAAELHPGPNEVRVQVYTTLIRAFEGQWFDHTAHCYREVGEMPQQVGDSGAPNKFGAAAEPPEPQLQMVWPEHLLDAPPAVHAPPGYTLRTYQPGDEPGWFRLMALAGWPGWDEAKLRPWLARIPPGSWFMVIHQASGEIVASALGLHDHSADHPFGGELGWVAADPAHAGRGLGQAVCAAVTARLLAAGYRNVHLYTERWRLAALKTYLKMGYVPFLYQAGMAEAWEAVCAQIGWPADPQTWRRT
jgi:GNAT superfamily N-acetyltransferase